VKDQQPLSLYHHQNTQPLGLYIHIPFCAQKCPYCDFNTYARLEPLYESYTQALCQELRQWADRLAGRTLHTVFLGGGTPTVLSAEQLTQILETVHKRFTLAPDIEITSESNPGTADQEKFTLLHGLGVNRLSMGVQSFQAEELTFLGRIHSTDDVLHAYQAALAAGFTNINLDFMFGLPQQSAQAWDDTLKQALDLAPQHLSLYSLIVEPHTPLFHWVQTGQVPPTDEDLAADLYEMALVRLQAAGYRQYEVSNWARNSASVCQHNLLYWRNQEWIGVGPGAHSHLRYPPPQHQGPRIHDQWLDMTHPTSQRTPAPAVAVRWSNRRGVQSYTKRIAAGTSPVDFQEEVSEDVSRGETMMLGLRLVQEGVPFSRFEHTHGRPLHAIFGPKLEQLQDAGLLESDNKRVRLTSKGLLIGDQVFREFVTLAGNHIP